MLRTRLCAMVVFTMSGAAAVAAEPTRAPTQTDMNQAASEAYAQARKALVAVVAEVEIRATKPQQRTLRDAQAAWARARDLDCRFEASGVTGGSAQAMVAGQCLTRKTVERAEALRRYLDCPEGDLACPLRG